MRVVTGDSSAIRYCWVMDTSIFPRGPKPPLKEATLEEVRQGLLRDAKRQDVPWRAAQLYRELAETIAQASLPRKVVR